MGRARCLNILKLRGLNPAVNSYPLGYYMVMSPMDVSIGKKGTFDFFTITEAVKEDLAFFDQAGTVIRSAP